MYICLILLREKCFLFCLMYIYRYLSALMHQLQNPVVQNFFYLKKSIIGYCHELAFSYSARKLNVKATLYEDSLPTQVPIPPPRPPTTIGSVCGGIAAHVTPNIPTAYNDKVIYTWLLCGLTVRENELVSYIERHFGTRQDSSRVGQAMCSLAKPNLTSKCLCLFS